jgi:hypothetical protein
MQEFLQPGVDSGGCVVKGYYNTRYLISDHTTVIRPNVKTSSVRLELQTCCCHRILYCQPDFTNILSSDFPPEISPRVEFYRAVLGLCEAAVSRLPDVNE